MIPKLSVFNRIIGDSGFELEFTAFLDSCQGEIVSFAKNFFAVGFKLDYVNADGDISNYSLTKRSLSVVGRHFLEKLEILRRFPGY